METKVGYGQNRGDKTEAQNQQPVDAEGKYAKAPSLVDAESADASEGGSAPDGSYYGNWNGDKQKRLVYGVESKIAKSLPKGSRLADEFLKAIGSGWSDNQRNALLYMLEKVDFEMKTSTSDPEFASKQTERAFAYFNDYDLRYGGSDVKFKLTVFMADGETDGGYQSVGVLAHELGHCMDYMMHYAKEGSISKHDNSSGYKVLGAVIPHFGKRSFKGNDYVSKRFESVFPDGIINMKDSSELEKAYYVLDSLTKIGDIIQATKTFKDGDDTPVYLFYKTKAGGKVKKQILGHEQGYFKNDYYLNESNIMSEIMADVTSLMSDQSPFAVEFKKEYKSIFDAYDDVLGEFCDSLKGKGN